MNPVSTSDWSSWDPDDASPHPTLFGLPPAPDTARIHILPVPWEATCSYGRGTAQAPDAVRRASHQLDLVDPVLGEIWRTGIHLHGIAPEILAWSLEARSAAERIDESALEDDDRGALLAQIDELSARRSAFVEDWTTSMLEQGRVPGILGGDHSSPLGAIRAVAAKGELSILHLDAHLDQRRAYEGHAESHASILYNVLEQCPQVNRLLSLGIRDYSAGEWQRVQGQPDRVKAIPMPQWEAALFAGQSFDDLCAEALAFVGERVWISFDIDALSPDLCPHTGTPVPGGLSFAMATHLLHLVAASGRQVMGFDLCEVWGPSSATLDAAGPEEISQLEWDANVGARILYKLCGCID
jgi:agmatinase